MLTYEKLKNSPQLFKSFTGLTLNAFWVLLPAFRQAYEDDLDRRDEQREQPRQRRRGGGRKGVMQTDEDRLVFILFYFRGFPLRTGATPDQRVDSSFDTDLEPGIGIRKATSGAPDQRCRSDAGSLSRFGIHY